MPRCFGESKFVTQVEISLLLLNHLLVEVTPMGVSDSFSKAYTCLVGKVVWFCEPHFFCRIPQTLSQGGHVAQDELMRCSLPGIWD